jgi:8-oxo-dGTP diphosphatase
MPETLPVFEVPPALLVVAAALVDAQGRVLMQQRPQRREHGGLWEFPGGKIEPGEGPAAALIRELHEELAIVVAPEACVPLGFAATEAQGSARSVVLLLYGCRDWRGQPVSQEGAAWAWCDAASLALLAMPPLDVPLTPIAAAFAQG